MKETKLENINLKMGDIITFEDGNKIIVSTDIDFPASFLRIIKVQRAKYETLYEESKEILDKKEKEYLENVLRPFKYRVKGICKYELTRNENHYANIRIILKNPVINTILQDLIILPPFESNKMYQGMELNKSYTIQELGLFEE